MTRYPHTYYGFLLAATNRPVRLVVLVAVLVVSSTRVVDVDRRLRKVW